MTRGKRIILRLGKKTIQGVIDTELYALILKEAKLQGRTRSNIIKFILNDYFYRHMKLKEML